MQRLGQIGIVGTFASGHFVSVQRLEVTPVLPHQHNSHLEKDASPRKDVGFPSTALLCRNFGRAVHGGFGVHMASGRGRDFVLDISGNAEVGICSTPAFDQDVGRFDISMFDPLAVDVGQSSRQTPKPATVEVEPLNARNLLYYSAVF